MNFAGSGLALIEASGEDKENHERPQSRQRASRPSFKGSTSRTQVYSPTAAPAGCVVTTSQVQRVYIVNVKLILKFRSYLTGNMTTANRIMLSMEIISVYWWNNKKYVSTVCGQIAGCFIIKTGGTTNAF